MSFQIRKLRHPHDSFWQNLFRSGPRSARLDAVAEAAITLADLEAMPKEAQLLFAYSLVHCNPDMTLLASDTDACKPLSAGWLTSLPSPTIGAIRFKIKPHVWRKLTSFGSRFLTDDLLSELKDYKKRKSALYPWLWL
jgi:hypothetical protein